MKNLIHVALFAALTVASGFVQIPLIPVPFTLQTLMVYLSGDLLGAKKAALSQILFLIIGLSGIPVFTSGGGLGYIFQPTFGYLLGFPAAAWFIGIIVNRHDEELRFLRIIGINAMGMIIILMIGVAYLWVSLNLFFGKSISLMKAMIGGGLIFLPAEILKIAVSAILAIKTRRILHTAMGMIFVLMFLSGGVYAQSQTRLSKIRNEIQILESEYKKKEAKEITLMEQLEIFDREIGLRQGFLAELLKELEVTEASVDDAELKFEQAIDNRKRQRELVLRRMVSMYKKGRMAEWEALVSMGSLNQALVWIKYQKRIMENDNRNFRLLQKKEVEVEIKKNMLKMQLNQKQRLVQENTEEKKKYEKDKGLRKKLLQTVNREKMQISEQLQEKRTAYKKIEGWITQEENRRKEEEKKKWTVEKTIPQIVIKPNLKPIWPVQGRVISKYGKQLDPQTRTWTVNQGVDIETQIGGKVKAAMKGLVKYVTWLPLIGNLVLLDHGGLYTVYGHLDAIYVINGDSVEQGKVIGQVGDKTSAYGPVLHFQVWNGKTLCDPLAWLR